MREMCVLMVGLDPLHDEPLLLLQETADQRRILPVWVGVPEAAAIEVERRHVPTPRPTAHHLICRIVEAFAHRLEQVCITTLRDAVFRAELVMDGDIRVPARASDGVVLALHLGLPILVADAVLDEVGISGAHVIDLDEAAGDDPPREGPAAEEEEIEQFRRFLDDASPEDFGRR